MEKIKLTLGEVLSLSDELAGNPNAGTVGLLNDKIPFKTRYWLLKLNKKLTNEVELFQKIRTDLIEELGEKDKESGQLIIPATIKKGKKDIENPAIEVFNAKMLEMVGQEIEIEHAVMVLDDFENVEGVYEVIMKLIKE